MSANTETHPANLFDPVSGRAFAAGNVPLSSIYRGRAYYFESRENRDTFESDPEKYIAASPIAGQAIGSEETPQDRSHGRHGCC